MLLITGHLTGIFASVNTCETDSCAAVGWDTQKSLLPEPHKIVSFSNTKPPPLKTHLPFDPTSVANV